MYCMACSPIGIGKYPFTEPFLGEATQASWVLNSQVTNSARDEMVFAQVRASVRLIQLNAYEATSWKSF